jgi:hypothetical protein
MRIKEKFFVITVAILAGFLGGFFSNLILQTKSASAQGIDLPGVISAKEFKLVDRKGRIYGSFGLNEFSKISGRIVPSVYLRLGFRPEHQVIISVSRNGGLLRVKGSKSSITLSANDDLADLILLNSTEKGATEKIKLATSAEKARVYIKDNNGDVLWSAP